MLHGKLRHRSQAVRIGEALLTRGAVTATTRLLLMRCTGLRVRNAGVIKPTGKVEFKDSSEIYTF
jgi:hypothetical protein